MRYLYFYGSYFFCYSNIVYKFLNNKKPNPYHCTTLPSSIYTLSSVLFSPLMLPVNLSHEVFINYT